ncbi:uncharacterized protein TNCT_734081 [Trichonephila clavata]|uniref:Uncharacterized protein n=1 Tax=Trichonephila clavata TaxID=2740835 RepID=A0A8X6LH66_TRICU|nr:uncharacterized protein TNCT_734081 [Trichonephila clavata]
MLMVFTKNQNPVIPRENADPRAVEHLQGNIFLVANLSNLKIGNFGNWFSSFSNERSLFTSLHLDDLKIKDVDYLNSLHKSSWRRVFDRDLSLFSCSDQDIAAYVREQTKISKPMNVFKQILIREIVGLALLLIFSLHIIFNFTCDEVLWQTRTEWNEVVSDGFFTTGVTLQQTASWENWHLERGFKLLRTFGLVKWGLGGSGHVEGIGEKLSFASQAAR